MFNFSLINLSCANSFLLVRFDITVSSSCLFFNSFAANAICFCIASLSSSGIELEAFFIANRFFRESDIFTLNDFSDDLDDFTIPDNT